jgi:hypothetical protein
MSRVTLGPLYDIRPTQKTPRTALYADFCGDWEQCSPVVVGGNAWAFRLKGDDPVSRQTAVLIVDVGQPVNPRRAQNLCHGREMPHAQANETGG